MKNKKDNLKDILGKKCLRRKNFSSFTTLKLGGNIGHFYQAGTTKELIKALICAEALAEKYIVIGDGSNLLVSDKGFGGLVIKNSTKGIIVDGNRVEISSGENLWQAIKIIIDKGLGGIENMSAVPGTVGGAIYGNAGAYGQTISDKLVRVKVYKDSRIYWLNKDQCGFDYRESRFKKTGEIILKGEFFFEKSDRKVLLQKANEIVDMRMKKFPPKLKCPGSFFKNIPAEELSKDVLVKIPKDKIVYGKLPVAYLLEQVGAKGDRLGKVKVTDYHANLFVNLGGANSKDFYTLAKKYQRLVYKKYGIKIEPEVQFVGFNK